jgi:uncharacterized protein DUF6498
MFLKIDRKTIESFLKDKSAWALLGVNIFSLLAAVIKGWSLSEIMFIYWCQNIIIGIFTIIKILSLRLEPIKGVDAKQSLAVVRYFIAGFFAVHYGLFHYGYFEFLGGSWKDVYSVPIVLAIALFFFNHLFSFCYNYGNDSIKNIGLVMFAPYPRIVPMHITIIVGMFVSLLIKGQAANIAIIIIFLSLKSIIDVKMHLNEHLVYFAGSLQAIEAVKDT